MPPLSFFPRKSTLFSTRNDGAETLVLTVRDGGGLALGPKGDARAGRGDESVADCPPGGALQLLFGPLWLTVYVQGAPVARLPRTDSAGPYQLSHDGLASYQVKSYAEALPDLPENLAGLDRAQLFLLADQPEEALTASRGLRATSTKDDEPFRLLLESRALRQVFDTCKQDAIRLAGEGARAKALDRIQEALSLYEPPSWTEVPSRAAPARKVLILADLSLPQCRHYRVDQKLEQLTAAGIDHALFDQKDSDAFIQALGSGTLAILYRLPLYPKIQQAIAACKAAHIPCLYEIDDLLFDELAFPGPRADYGADFPEAAYHELLILPPLYRAALAACDGAIASTPALAEAMRHVVGPKPVFVHANGLDSQHKAAMAEAARDGKAAAPDLVRLFYGSGTRALQQDFDKLAEHVLAPLMARRPQLRLMLAGHVDTPECLSAVADRIERIVPQSLGDYWRTLKRADINLAPLSPSRFNDCKSAIKWLEAAMFHIPTVMSVTETYKALVSDGEDGCLAADWAAWTASLETLVDAPAARHKIGAKAHETARRQFDGAELARNIAAIVTGAEASLS